jgi:hypothetical protein
MEAEERGLIHGLITTTMNFGISGTVRRLAFTPKGKSCVLGAT